MRPSRSRLAIVSRFIARSVSACALPRPSAIASAKLAKSTVNQSQTDTAPVKNFGSLRLPKISCEEHDGRDGGADLDDEHHRVAEQVQRVQLPERVDDRLADDRPVPDRRARLARLGDLRPVLGWLCLRCIWSSILDPPTTGCRACTRKCSTIGPSASAGKNVSPPTMITTPTRKPTNSGESVGSVPALAGTFFFCTSAPASARIATIGRKRPEQHRDAARACCRTTCWRVRPANAEPLLPATDENA